MQKTAASECTVHSKQKLRKFCKEPDCWIRICPKCAAESHKGHHVVEYTTLTNEAKSAKDKLLQARKGDLMSVKRMLNGLTSLQTQLKDTQERRKEEAKLTEMQVLTYIRKMVKEGESRFKELKENLAKVQATLREYQAAQAQEVQRIPELADAVIYKGTPEDLKTFFEMCQKGLEANGDILEQKESTDAVKKGIEEFVSNNPFAFAFTLGSGKDEDERSESMPFQVAEWMGKSMVLPREEKTLEEVLNATITSTEIISPMLKTIDGSTCAPSKGKTTSKPSGRNTPSVGLNRRKTVRTQSTVPDSFVSRPKTGLLWHGDRNAKKSVCDQSTLRKMAQKPGEEKNGVKKMKVINEKKESEGNSPLTARQPPKAVTRPVIHKKLPSEVPKKLVKKEEPAKIKRPASPTKKESVSAISRKSMPPIIPKNNQQKKELKGLERIKKPLKEFKNSLNSIATIISQGLKTFSYEFAAKLKEKLAHSTKPKKPFAYKPKMSAFADAITKTIIQNRIKEQKTIYATSQKIASLLLSTKKLIDMLKEKQAQPISQSSTTTKAIQNEEQIQSLLQQINTLQKQIQSIPSLESELKLLRKKSGNVDSLANEIKILEQRNAELVAKLEVLEAESKELQGKSQCVSTLNDEIKALKSMNEQLIATKGIQENALEEQQKKHTNLKTQHNELVTRYNHICSRVESLSEKLKNTKEGFRLVQTAFNTLLDSFINKCEEAFKALLKKCNTFIEKATEHHEAEKEKLMKDIENYEKEKKEQSAQMEQKAAEFQAILKLKDDEVVKMQEETQKKLMESEEFQGLILELEQRRAEVVEKDSQLEAMYNKIVSMEEPKGEEEGKEMVEELKKKLEEAEKVNDEMLEKYEQCQAEYDQLQTQYVELTRKYKEATAK